MSDSVVQELKSIEASRTERQGSTLERTQTIQELERQLADLQSAHDSFRAAAQRKDDFLALLAHELRNPLAPLLSALQLMELSPDDMSQYKLFRAILSRQVEQLMRLVDDLRDISRITRGKLTLEKVPLDLAGAMEAACDLAGPLLEEAGHRFTRTFPGSKLIVAGDKVRLAQIIGNLLINAAKFTPPGGQVELLLRRDGEHVDIRVRDNGVGISAEKLPRIFELFMQVNETRERSQGGLGIGLSLAKTLVEMHGGSIRAESAGEGAGSEFVVRLPLVTKAVAEAMVASRALQATSETHRQLPARKILVVDDNVAQAHLLSRLLQKLGQHAYTAGSAAAALESLEKSQPDVIISDIGMPEVSGYDLARKFRSSPQLKHITLIAVTGFQQESDREEAHAAGFDHYLTKPVGIKDLEELLESLASKALLTGERPA
ncbi:MAG: response regulator [Pirellulaceae bacterium]|nr:response regulator [Pirellulaceae bacterium]